MHLKAEWLFSSKCSINNSYNGDTYTLIQTTLIMVYTNMYMNNLYGILCLHSRLQFLVFGYFVDAFFYFLIYTRILKLQRKII